MRIATLLLAVAFAPQASQAQLSTAQKLEDFQYMAGVFAKRYGPYEWKRDFLKYDALDIGPWISRISTTKTDLEFFDVMSEYVGRLNDAHSVYILPSNFVARLNFEVDIYDDKLIVDFINRTRLPASEYGFNIGYELVSIDGESALTILNRLMPYRPAANLRSTRRITAS